MDIVEKLEVVEKNVIVLPWYLTVPIVVVIAGIVVWSIIKNKKGK